MRKNVIQHKNVLNAITCYPMQLCKNVLSNAKRVNKCKNCVIQWEKMLSNARNVLYNATNGIFDKKNLQRKICIAEKYDLGDSNFKTSSFLHFRYFM